MKVIIFLFLAWKTNDYLSYQNFSLHESYGYSIIELGPYTDQQYKLRMLVWEWSFKCQKGYRMMIFFSSFNCILSKMSCFQCVILVQDCVMMLQTISCLFQYILWLNFEIMLCHLLTILFSFVCEMQIYNDVSYQFHAYTYLYNYCVCSSLNACYHIMKYWFHTSILLM